MRALGERGIQSLLVEGGAELGGTLVAAGAVDRLAWFLAPILIGGREAPSALGGAGAPSLAPRAPAGRGRDGAGGRRSAGDGVAGAPWRGPARCSRA